MSSGLYRAARVLMRRAVTALERQEGYPKAPTFIGSACAGIVSRTVPGIGWSTALTDVPESAGQVDVEIDDDVVDRHEGKTVNVDGTDITLDLKGRRVGTVKNVLRAALAAAKAGAKAGE